ncbi:MAG: MFS transporter [Clostridiales bacterium]|nr:MFS transporter [Clostridiales bacterium]
MKKKLPIITPAMTFILLFSIVSLLSDMTHEGAASIRGAYLSLLGASAATIGFVSGLGELAGYSLRLLFGRFADKTKRYWLITIIGYVIDVLAVPALALSGEHGWIFASSLIVIERIGKAIKKPAKSTLVSFAATREGVGKSFAIAELIDQLGAFLGPVMLYVTLLFKQTGSLQERYAFSLGLLIIPAAATILMLFVTKRKFPNPEHFEPEPKQLVPFKLNRKFLLYLAGISLFAFGFIDYSLILMHVSRTHAALSSGLSETTSFVNSGTLPLLYAGAMLIDAAAAMIFGLMYDKKGMRALILSTALSAPFALLVFGNSSTAALIVGIAMWGVGMGAQESILKAAVAGIVPKASRATGYGIFEFVFGVFWFLGSWLLGALYDVSLPVMIAVSVGAQVLAIPLYYLSSKSAE